MPDRPGCLSGERTRMGKDNKKGKEARKPKAAHNVKAKSNASQPSLKTGKVGGLEHLGNKPKK